MKIAIPMAADRLCLHFGHCERFAVIEADEQTRQITGVSYQTPPPHEPGVIPRWIGSLGVDVVIAGGMGAMALRLMEDRNIQVITGAPSLPPEELAKAFLDGTLATGDNVCSHES